MLYTGSLNHKHITVKIQIMGTSGFRFKTITISLYVFSFVRALDQSLLEWLSFVEYFTQGSDQGTVNTCDKNHIYS